MIARLIKEEEKDLHNSVVQHPVQSWQWGEFRQDDAQKVERVGFFDQGKLVKAFQISYKPIPIIGGNFAYVPRAFMPDKDQIDAIKDLCKKNNAVFVKLEPDVKKDEIESMGELQSFLKSENIVRSKSLFYQHTFELDLSPSEEELFAKLKNKTRYNINLSYKKGVRIIEQSNLEGLETYIKILAETTKRNSFYLHTPEYFRKMWQHMSPSKTARIFHAIYEGQVLASWIMFVFNDKLYYPYGASSSAHRDVMASNLMMWEMIKFGKAQGCKIFDMWGALGADASSDDPWFGFHRFKKGYGGELKEFIGSYDLIYNPFKYKLFNLADSTRWKVLRLKAKFLK